MHIDRRGQAMVELALGMLALVIVVSALCGFAIFMTRSLRAQNSCRTGSTEGNGRVEVDIRIGGGRIGTMSVRERCTMPATSIAPDRP